MKGVFAMGLIARLIGWLWHKAEVDPPAPPPPPPTPPATPGVLKAVNAARLAHGLLPLKEDPRLTALASDWSQVMAERGVLAHGVLGDRIYHLFPNVSAAEDIAVTPSVATDVVSLWMKSPAHKANILGDFNTAGVGVARGDLGVYWTMDFVKA